jgi:hypothetical protein
MSRRGQSARAVRRMVGIGQRWRDRRNGTVVAVYQVHRADQRAEVHREGEDPRVPRIRFQVASDELGRDYELFDERKETA